MSTNIEPSGFHKERVFPQSRQKAENAIPLSLLDATTVNFALTNALWLFEPWKKADLNTGKGTTDFSLRDHLQKSLSATLNAYPQWCGHLKIVGNIDGKVEDEAKHFSPHARRFGRVYTHYGTETDPGVEFISCSSPATLDMLYPESRPTKQPIWDRQGVSLKAFIPQTKIASPSSSPRSPDQDGLLEPLLAIQLTELACGGFVVAAKITHPLADITALAQLIKDWSRVSSARLAGSPEPSLNPVFDPALVDSHAAGDINADQPDNNLVEQTRELPFHRYDWWTSSDGAPWPLETPSVFLENSPGESSLPPAGKAMPWSEWDVKQHVSHYTIHLTHDQIEHLWKQASGTSGGSSPSSSPPSPRISRHDAVLAHIWSCITRARNLQHDTGPVYCDLTYGLRPVLKLGESFLGSPIIMVKTELSGAVVAASSSAPDAKGEVAMALAPLARGIRTTLDRMSQTQAVAAHLHTVAYEKSPQRIWQAFLGRRHILVTTWARAGLYDVDFGLGSRVVYADGFIPELEGDVLIKEAPPSWQADSDPGAAAGRNSWTRHGVDVSINICDDDMARLIRDPLLLPEIVDGEGV
ncbi:unnamed protein product [Clonostachys byssicola]|uniref:Transferase family protein n=1 Tax=Clonostachys byssicola TaxID=160290 RepID=A0A9N9XW06_9HYPO|nr:unnamed protein product [Clonostachys byssicola]